ncbi:MAG: carboxypeptidase-like regulatory domain-containing protein [Caldilineaceae bacterium]
MSDYTLPQPTGADGGFTFPANRNTIRRYPVTVADASQSQVGGAAATDAQKAALAALTGGINVRYAISDVTTTAQSDGSIKLSGKLAFADDTPPTPVTLYGFQLSGRVTDTQGEPIPNVIVSTKSPALRWSISEVTDADGRYTSVFWPDAHAGFQVTVVDGAKAYDLPKDQTVEFPYLQSAEMDLVVDRANDSIQVARLTAADGAIYEGVLVGISVQGTPVQPTNAAWPDAQGNFSLVVPGTVQGVGSVVAAPWLLLFTARRPAGQFGRPGRMAAQACARCASGDRALRHRASKLGGYGSYAAQCGVFANHIDRHPANATTGKCVVIAKLENLCECIIITETIRLEHTPGTAVFRPVGLAVGRTAIDTIRS